MAEVVDTSGAYRAARVLSIGVVLAVAAAACGGSGDDAAPATTAAPVAAATTAPTTVAPTTTGAPTTVAPTTSAASDAGLAYGVRPDVTTTAPTTSTTAAPTTTSAEPVGTVIEIGDLFFRPPSLTISVGETVTWQNDGSLPHTSTAGTPSERSGDWHSGTLGSGESFSITFDTVGTFQYFCSIHPNEMQATVTVSEG